MCGLYAGQSYAGYFGTPGVVSRFRKSPAVQLTGATMRMMFFFGDSRPRRQSR